MSYTLVNSSQAAQQAYLILSASKHLFLDCEGKELGCVDGVLRLITIGTVLAREVFLFDVQALRRDDLQPVLDLLADEETPKIVWDGRMDSIELRRTFGVRIGLVLDLQVADVKARAKRGFVGAVNYMHPGNPLYFARKLDTAGVHTLTSLKKARAAHGVLAATAATKQQNISHDKWLKTPLPKQYLDYAASDIYELAHVYGLFQSRSYVGTNAKPQPDLFAASERYVHMHTAPLPREHAYQQSNLMPLEVLNVPPNSGPTSLSACDKCRRMLTAASFTYRAGNVPKKQKAGGTGGQGAQLHSSCKVCYLLDAREKARAQKKSASAPPAASKRAGASGRSGLTPRVTVHSPVQIEIGHSFEQEEYDDDFFWDGQCHEDFKEYFLDKYF